MEVRKAAIEDLHCITDIFKRAIGEMDVNGIPQWDEIYPNEEIIRDDIRIGQMYAVLQNGDIVSVFVLNQECDKEYLDAKWRYPNASYQVIHRLCVNPTYQNKGIGRETMLSIEGLLRRDGIDTIRLDAFSKNPFALRMYERLGFKKVGEANWRKGLFYLYEKKIS